MRPGLRPGWPHLASLPSPHLRGEGRQRPRGQKGWVESVTTLSTKGWTPAVDLPASTGRISVFSRILPVSDGSLWVAYSSDARARRNYHRPIWDVALVTSVPAPPGEAGIPQLAAYRPPDPPAGIPAWNASREAKQVARIREQRVSMGGVPTALSAATCIATRK